MPPSKLFSTYDYKDAARDSRHAIYDQYYCKKYPVSMILASICVMAVCAVKATLA